MSWFILTDLSIVTGKISRSDRLVQRGACDNTSSGHSTGAALPLGEMASAAAALVRLANSAAIGITMIMLTKPADANREGV